MRNSILFSKIIYKKLKSSESLKQLVNNKIYPLVAENSATFPFIVYYKENITSTTDTKDFLIEDDVEFSVIVVSDDYNNSLEIADAARKALEFKSYSDESLSAYSCKMIDYSESYIENAYVQALKFSCTIQ